MDHRIFHQVEVAVGDGGRVSRRSLLRTAAIGAGAGSLNWPAWMNLQADELRKREMACIVLWMQGGPSQFETLAPSGRFSASWIPGTLVR